MRLVPVLLPLLGLAPLSAEVQLPPLFGDHAVLLANDEVPIWGTAREGEAVTVRFAGAEAKTVAAKGRWEVRLKGLKASASGQDLVVSGDNTVTSHDVLVGEVWVCSGQSNMERQLGPRPPQQAIENYEAEASGADFPAMRFFTVPHVTSLKPLEVLSGRWEVMTPTSALTCTAVGFFFGRAIHQARKTPVGLIHTSWGGTPAQAWTSREALSAVPDLHKNLVEKYDQAVAEYPAKLADFNAHKDELTSKYAAEAAAAKAAGKQAPRPPGPPRDPQTSSGSPGLLFNSMIAPLVPYGVRGVLWYQGESNSGNPTEYESLLPTMIADWRGRWGRDELPFLIVQIAPHGSMPPELREAQSRIVQKTPATGLVCTLDIGDAKDIHPTRKRPVGERLALVARKQVYGEDVVASGPRFSSLRVEGAQAILSFKEVAGGLVAQGDALKGFTIAGADQVFVEATAEIKGQTVVVSSPKVSAPVAVRYGWANAPVATLANKEGLPAFPFRTDEWPTGRK